MGVDELQDVANELPFLKSAKDKEKMLSVVGALALRRISLDKAADIMKMQRDAFLTLLDMIGVDFSYLAYDCYQRSKNLPKLTK